MKTVGPYIFIGHYFKCVPRPVEFLVKWSKNRDTGSRLDQTIGKLLHKSSSSILCGSRKSVGKYANFHFFKDILLSGTNHMFFVNPTLVQFLVYNRELFLLYLFYTFYLQLKNALCGQEEKKMLASGVNKSEWVFYLRFLSF